MKLPADVEYAYKAVIELSLRYNGDNPIQLNVISDSQGIPKKFLIQLLLRLKNAGIVNSTRGSQGGYYLTRPPSRISLADLFKAVDDVILAVPKKARPGKTTDTEKILLGILTGISEDTAERLAAITFDKLTAQIKNEQLTYYI